MITNTINKFETHLLSIRAERQKMIHPKSHPIPANIISLIYSSSEILNDI